ncbi:vacuolar protein sorting-associated protein 13D [Caerostris extrusa]|uniref:Vacuolar protein sorting-associated protein 13D n=1 Tax=Caerostris extrusa TaxID=172846 RepID=A0AAV4TMK5_CAEEX|nr:vacuolar protein sorting-associated protein 13D [Caerostris extrusa]
MVLRTRFESTDDVTDDLVFLTSDQDVTVDMKLDILLQTPVVAFPTSAQNLTDLNKENTVFIEVRHEHAFCKCGKKAQISTNLKSVPGAIVLPNLPTKDLYTCEDKNRLIIHDTVLEVVFSSHKSDIASEMATSLLETSSGIHYEKILI